MLNIYNFFCVWPMTKTKERPKPRGVCSPTILKVKSLEGKPRDVNLC